MHTFYHPHKFNHADKEVERKEERESTLQVMLCVGDPTVGQTWRLP